jgi:hypothetical protein
MVDSYPNFIHTAERRLSTYPRESVLLSQFVNRSESDKQNSSLGEYRWIQVIYPKTSNKLGSSSGHNPLGPSMKTDYHRHIQLC